MEVLLGLLIGLVFALLLFKPAKEIKPKVEAFTEPHFHRQLKKEIIEESIPVATSYEYNQTQPLFHPDYFKQQTATQPVAQTVSMSIDLAELRREVERYGILDNEGRLMRPNQYNYREIRQKIAMKKIGLPF